MSLIIRSLSDHPQISSLTQDVLASTCVGDATLTKNKANI